jgi:hypothetical protein
MKYITFSALLLTASSALSQDLAYKIPPNAIAVASVKGDKLLELLSARDFDNSFLGRKFAKSVKRDNPETHYKGIEDFGIQLNGTAYYYRVQTDSISYNCVLAGLADAGKFEQRFEAYEKEKIETQGSIKKLVDGSSIVIWDREKVCFVSGTLNDHFLENDSVRSERYGIKKVDYSDYYYQTSPAPGEEFTLSDTVAAVAVEEYTPVVDSAVAVAAEEPAAVDPSFAEIPPPPPPPSSAANAATADADEAVTEAAPMEQYEYTPSAYEHAYEAQRNIKKKLTAEWVYQYALNGFSKNGNGSSILDNPAYQRSLDKDAAASFYLADVPSLYQGVLPYYSYRYLGLANAMQGYGSINARLYLNKEDARIVTAVEVDEKKAASYKKMYAHKPNKKFAKYINSDKMVAFMSYSFDTEAYLKELPELLDQSMAHYFGLYNDEIGIGAELFSLLLDEKAVAKVVKGDAVLLLSDVGPKEYTYTTYDYNDDYERSEIKKTKTETLPDFLFMLSSDDTRIFERMLNYGVKKEKIVLKNGIYSLDKKLTGRSPFQFHVLIKDGIIFCGTAYRDMQQISNDTYQGNMTREQKDLLLKNNMSLYVNPKNLVGKISEKEFGSSRRLHDFNTLLGSTGTMYARTTGIKGNRISAEMVATVPQDKGNALKYFLSLIEYASKLD